MSVRNGERVTEIGDQTFLDTKEGKESEKGGGESECAPLWSERARRRHGVSQRTEKVISIGFARGGWEENGDGRRGREEKERERKRWNEDVEKRTETSVGGPMDRRGTASASPKNASPGSGEVLGPARFSRVRSVLGKAILLLCGARSAYSYGALRRAYRGPVVLCYFSFAPPLFHPLPIASRVRGLSSSPR